MTKMKIKKNKIHCQLIYISSLFLANRIHIQHDFGYVSLNIYPTYPEDSGTYTCVAVNRTGKAQTSARLVCYGRESLILQSQHEDSLERIKYLEGHHVRIGPLSQDRPEEFHSMEKPNFSKQLRPMIEAKEGQFVHMECRLVPVHDPKMVVEWYKDGTPLPSGHRFRPMYDFGYVALDILYAYAEDSGTYTVMAKNGLGIATCDGKLVVHGRRALYLEPQHPEGLERIQQLESSRMIARSQEPDRVCEGPPKLMGQLRDQMFKEGNNLHLELRVEPVNDPTMRVEWYVNGRHLLTGSRVMTTFDFGYLSLDIKTLIAEDSGEYTARVYNALGEVSSTCSILVECK